MDRFSSKLRQFGPQLRYFSPKTISFWTSIAAVIGLFIPNRKAQAIAGYAGLVCGLGGAGMVYERVASRAECPREPVHVARHATTEEHASLWLHLLFGAVGLRIVYKALTPRS